MSSRISRALLLFTAVCLLSLCSFAQPRAGGNTTLNVRVVNNDGRPATEQLKVELLTSSGLLFYSGFTDSLGMASFPVNRSGGYRIRVTGNNIPETVGDNFFVDTRHSSQMEVITLQETVRPTGPGKGPAAVAVVDLNVPKRAQKEFEKGAEAFERSDFAEARKQFDKAIAAHPSYASAYNLLGMTLMRQGEAQSAQQAFEKALELNDRFALAYTNLAKLYLAQRNLERSEFLLRKSVAAEPRSSETLAILSQVLLMAGKYDEAVVNARRVHDLPHQEYAIAHFVAARALRARNQRNDAMAEYKLFLQEAPNSASSSQARQELAQLENQGP
ncbi:MAG: tetratricopeptide repeat protein [Acidobacteriales bacterium]|nr:tetratricopeptide repeat protein [Terriglobales bacterium]